MGAEPPDDKNSILSGGPLTDVYVWAWESLFFVSRPQLAHFTSSQLPGFVEWGGVGREGTRNTPQADTDEVSRCRLALALELA